MEWDTYSIMPGGIGIRHIFVSGRWSSHESGVTFMTHRPRSDMYKKHSEQRGSRVKRYVMSTHSTNA